MRHSSGRSQSFTPLLLSVLILFLSIAGSEDLGATRMNKIEGTVWYRERMLLPPDAEVSITLEDVSRLDVRSELIAVTRFMPQGGPPWNFTLEYDPAKIHEKGRYALRARIEAGGRLIFTSTEHIAAFGRKPEKPVKILVSQVSSQKKKKDAPTQNLNANLTDTYWKLIELHGGPAALGAGERELHMVLITEDSRIRGFSGCNTFAGIYKVEEDHLQFLQMASTGKACMVGMEQERRFLSALKGTAQFTISGDSLSLYSADGEILLRLEAVYLR